MKFFRCSKIWMFCWYLLIKTGDFGWPLWGRSPILNQPNGDQHGWIREEWPNKIQHVHSGFFMQIDFDSKGKKLKLTRFFGTKSMETSLKKDSLENTATSSSTGGGGAAMHPEMMASSRGGDTCGCGSGGDTACPQQPAITTSSGCGGAHPVAGGAGGPKQAERTASSWTSKSSVLKKYPKSSTWVDMGALESRCHFLSESSIAIAEI